MIEMIPCPFCGSTDVDPEGWMSVDEDSNKNTGPACNECGGSTDTVERWNARCSADSVCPCGVGNEPCPGPDGRLLCDRTKPQTASKAEMIRLIEYEHDEKGSIMLPDGTPFDEKPVLVRFATGWCEAWWDRSDWCWVCLDDSAPQQELHDAKEWAPLPQSSPITTEQLTAWVQWFDWDTDLTTDDEIRQLRSLLQHIGFDTLVGMRLLTER